MNCKTDFDDWLRPFTIACSKNYVKDLHLWAARMFKDAAGSWGKLIHA